MLQGPYDDYHLDRLKDISITRGVSSETVQGGGVEETLVVNGKLEIFTGQKNYYFMSFLIMFSLLRY